MKETSPIPSRRRSGSLMPALCALALIWAASVATAAGPIATDLLSATPGGVQPFVVGSPGGACAAATPHVIIHDDGVAENGYGWNPVANVGRLASKFTPLAYPATLTTACFAFITNAGVTSFNFDIAVYAADGAGGAPGTQLGRMSFTGHPESIPGVPTTPGFEAFDISGMALDITSGSIYISAEWDAAVEPGGVYLAADQSDTTPLNDGYLRANDDPWEPIIDSRPAYRALFTRAVMPSAGSFACNAPAEGFEGGVPPLDWSVASTEPGGPQWTTIALSGETGNYTNGSGEAATVSSDRFGQAEFDTSLVTPAFDLSGVEAATLRYTVNYQNFSHYDNLDVDISTDDGATWTTLLSWNDDHGSDHGSPGEDVSINLSAWAGQSGLMLRWRYYDPNTGDWDWYAQIDDVRLTCGGDLIFKNGFDPGSP